MVSVPEFHNDLQYASGEIECDGLLEVVGTQGSDVFLECRKCREVIAVPRAVDTSWQDRADLQ